MNKYLYLLILVTFVLASVVSDNFILQAFGTLPFLQALMWSVGMLVLQMIAAPIQAGASDFYCRKKSLIIALSFTFFSIILLVFTKSLHRSWIIFLPVVLMNGMLGNIVPLVWSAVADRQDKDLRFSLAFTTGAYALAYMVLAFFAMQSIKIIPGYSWFSLDDSMPVIILVLSILICFLFFRDIRDKKLNKKEDEKLEHLKLAYAEFSSLGKEIRSKCTRSGLWAWILWATSQYSILILLTDFQNKYTHTVIFMMLGYAMGILMLGFLKNTRDEIMIKSAFVITISSFILFFAINYFLGDIKISLSFSYFFYTLSNAFLSASMLSLFSKERALNQQGKGFGLIISADSGGFLIATLVVLVFISLKIKMEYMVAFSFFSFLISWVPYKKYEKLRKNFV